MSVSDNTVSKVMAQIARKRWAKATDAQRKAQGEMLHEARQRKTTPEQRRAIARKAAAASAKARAK